jgi:ferredoxin--NADP+ reductase
MSGWVTATITGRHDWADGLWTLTLDRKVQPRAPGQWVNLALTIDGERVKRPYSVASAAGDPLEFYLLRVDGGALSPRLWQLAVGGEVEVEDQAYGFFTLEHVPVAQDLWLVASGTGLGPFMALVRDDATWERFEHVVLVHGVRHADDLGYRGELERLETERGGRLRYLRYVTREQARSCERERVTVALESGNLERSAGRALDPDSSHLMLCGNPAMIDDMQALLGTRGMRRHRSRKPGHITVESYW